jgi:hypothetical protein
VCLNLWLCVVLQQLSTQEMWQWVHTCYGDELGLTSDDEDYIPPASEEDKLSNTSVRSADSFSEVMLFITMRKTVLFFLSKYLFLVECHLFMVCYCLI